MRFGGTAAALALRPDSLHPRGGWKSNPDEARWSSIRRPVEYPSGEKIVR
jgi:hypothetical protein